jgi:hypothetical protein
MAQTTNAITQQCGQLDYSADGAAWTDISGVTQSITAFTQTRNSGEAYTFEGDTAIIGFGKRTPMDITVNIVYSETDAEAYEVIRTRFETDCGAAVYLRWSPGGGDAGDEQITSGAGQVTSWDYPMADATGGDPITCSFTVRVPGVTTSIVAS